MKIRLYDRLGGGGGYSLSEVVLSFGVLVLAFYAYLYYFKVDQQAKLRVTAKELVLALNRCRNLAVQSQQGHERGVVTVWFFPRGGPYEGCKVLLDRQVVSTVKFPPGIFLVDTNGILYLDRFWIASDGKLLNMHGDPTILGGRGASKVPDYIPPPMGCMTLFHKQLASEKSWIIIVSPRVGKFSLIEP